MSWKDSLQKYKKRYFAVGVAAVVVAGVALTNPAAASGSSPNGQQPVYKETPVQRGDVTTGISESGTASLEAIAVTYDDYSSQSSSSDSNNTVKALVEEVYVKAGQRVAVGDPIAKISTEEIQDSLSDLQQDKKSAQLALEKAKLDRDSGLITAKTTLDQRLNDAENADLNYELSLDQSAASLSTLKSQMQNNQDKLDAADAALEDFAEEPKRYEAEIATLRQQISDAQAAGEDTSDLEAQLASVQEDYDVYQRDYRENRQKLYTAYTAAANDFSSSKLKYEIAQNSQTLDETTAGTQRETALSYKESAQQLYDLEVAQLQNAVSSKELSLENLDKQIAKLQAYLTDGQVKATYEGLVMNVYVVAGDKISPNATLASIANSKNTYVSVAIDQEDIATLELGKIANILFDAYPDKKFTGKVDSISVTPAMGGSSTVSYNVKIKLDGEDASVYEGMTANVTFVTQEVKDVLTVSAKAVYQENDKSYVKIKAADGTISPVEVETGFTNGMQIEIKSGLNEGDLAIIESKVQVSK